jgi:hypothetical protein
MGMSAPARPQPRNLAEEMGAISRFATENAQSQANITVDTADRLSDQAIENTGDIAKKLEDSTYTAAANQNLRDAGTSAAQLGQNYTQVGQVADRVAAYNDPAQARLNQMAMGQLYRPDQISSQNVAADQVTGSRVADVGNMQTAQVGQVNNVQAATTGPIERVGGTQVGAVDPMEAARVRRVQDIQAQNVRASAAERGLMNEARGNGLLGQLESQASNDLALGRSLSAEQERDAIQSARAGAAARGLGLGQSAMAAELLNRDRFATARENERRTFAGNVLGQGAALRTAANQAYAQRMDANAGRSLQADSTNQSVAQARAMQNAQFAQQARLTDNQNAQQRVLAEAGYAQQAGLSNQDFGFRAASQDAQLAQQAALANQATALQLGQTNAQLRQQGYLTDNSNAQQAAMANAGYAQQAALSNQDANLRAAQYNSGQNFAAQQANQAANQQQEQYNRAFLGSVASQNFNQFQGQQGMLSSLYGQQAGIAQNQYANNLGLAQANVALDPYQRALGSNIPIASQGNAASMIGQSFGNTMNYGSDLYNTNLNMQASIYNSYQNNQAALRGAQIQAGAANQAGIMGMIGSLGGGAMAAGGSIAGAAILGGAI